ncbi:MAG: hypothetical protein M0T84_00270 [Betaproteobacteria bacterium]|nr:hypothetical protein [Betaproteobacteria bacterium]
MAKENLIAVIVRRGTLVVDKIAHKIGAEVKLAEEEAKRLLGLGVVARPTDKAPMQTSAPTATSADGPTVTTAPE